MKFFYVHGQLPGVGGGGTPYNGLSGEAPHKEIPFSSLSMWLGVWISLVETYETVWKSIISDCKKTQKGNRCILSWLWKSRENGLVLWFIHILKALHLQQLLPACRRLLFPFLHAEKGRLRNAVANRVPASRWVPKILGTCCDRLTHSAHCLT